MAEKKSFVLKRLRFKPNQTVFDEGDEAKEAYLILKGAVDIRIGVHGGHPYSLGKQKRGDIIGEMALFDDQPRMATAVAVEKTRVLAISRKEFRRRLNSMDPAMRGVALLMVKRMRQMARDLVVRKEELNLSGWRPPKTPKITAKKTAEKTKPPKAEDRKKAKMTAKKGKAGLKENWTETKDQEKLKLKLMKEM